MNKQHEAGTYVKSSGIMQGIGRVVRKSTVISLLIGALAGFFIAYVIWPKTDTKSYRKKCGKCISGDCKKHKKKYKGATFPQKYVLTKEEQSLYDKISASNAAFLATFSKEEKAVFQGIQQKVKQLISENHRIKISYKKVFAGDEPAKMLIKKIRKHQKEAKKKLDDDARKVRKKLIIKLSQKRLMDFYLYVRT